MKLGRADVVSTTPHGKMRWVNLGGLFRESLALASARHDGSSSWSQVSSLGRKVSPGGYVMLFLGVGDDDLGSGACCICMNCSERCGSFVSATIFHVFSFFSFSWVVAKRPRLDRHLCWVSSILGVLTATYGASNFDL